MEPAPTGDYASIMSQDKSLPRIHIASGLHAGADCILPNRPFTIGADSAADVILHDEGIAPVHLMLEPEGDDLKIIVRASGVSVEGIPLEPNDTVVAALPASITLGSVMLRCEGSATGSVLALEAGDAVSVRSATALLPRTTLGRAAGAGCLLALVVCMITLRTLLGNVTPAHAASHVQPVASNEGGVSGPVALRTLTSRELAVLGLKGIALDVQSGIVTVTGHIDPEEAPKIHLLEVWFDHRFGDGAVLLSQVVLAKQEPLSLSLQAVWAGPDPNIVVGGQRYAEGSTLPDGSVVQQISEHTVVLLQHGQPYSLEY